MITSETPFSGSDAETIFKKINDFKTTLAFPTAQSEDEIQVSVPAQQIIMKLIAETDERLGDEGNHNVKSVCT